ncbi:hypothetical protein ACFL02_00885 [Planctomycetota bacterium]
MWGLIGRAPTDAPLAAPSLANPILPLPPQEWTADDAREFYNGCFNAPQTPDPTALLGELLLSYKNSGRDFRDPPGPDGYVLQVIPVDRKYQPVQLIGRCTIILFNEPALNPDGSTGRPLYIWRILEQDLAKYWTPTHLLKGYLFKLDWGLEDPGPGNYELWVFLKYRNNNVVAGECRSLSFQEQPGALAPDKR